MFYRSRAIKMVGLPRSVWDKKGEMAEKKIKMLRQRTVQKRNSSFENEKSFYLNLMMNSYWIKKCNKK